MIHWPLVLLCYFYALVTITQNTWQHRPGVKRLLFPHPIWQSSISAAVPHGARRKRFTSDYLQRLFQTEHCSLALIKTKCTSLTLSKYIKQFQNKVHTVNQLFKIKNNHVNQSVNNLPSAVHSWMESLLSCALLSHVSWFFSILIMHC